MAELTDPITPGSETSGELSPLSGILQHRWQILSELDRGSTFCKYRVEEQTTKIQAVLIQRTYESRPADLKVWKSEFIEACKKRKENGGEPEIFDYFTRGDCLVLVQRPSSQDELRTAVPPAYPAIPSPPLPETMEEISNPPPVAASLVSAAVAPPTPAIQPMPPPIALAAPPPQPSADQVEAITRANNFTAGIEKWCAGVSPEGLAAVSFQEVIRLRRHVESFPREADEADFKAWTREWYLEAWNTCSALGSWMDSHLGGGKPPKAEKEFDDLLKLLNIEQIRPAFKGRFISDDYQQVGVYPSREPSERPGTIASIRRRGFRQNGCVLRKAEVVVFAPAPSPPPPPTPRGPSVLTVLFSVLGGFTLAALLFWWLGHERKSSFPAGETKAGAPVTELNRFPPIDRNKPSPLPPVETKKPDEKKVEPTNPVAEKKPEPGRVLIDQFTVTPDRVKAGQSLTVSWNVINATTVKITPGDLTGSSGTKDVIPPAGTSTFVLQAKGIGEGNSVTAQRSVQIMAAAKILEFAGDREQVPYGDPLRLHWKASDSTSVNIEPGDTRISAEQGDVTIPSVTTAGEYRLTATGPGGDDSAAWSFKVIPKIVSFETVSFISGNCDVALLRWSVKGSTSISIDNGLGVVTTAPYKLVRPAQTTRYTLTATGVSGQATAWVVVQAVRGNAACSPAPSPPTEFAPEAAKAASPTSGVLCKGTVNVPQFGQLVFLNLPGERLHFTFDHDAWQSTIRRQPDGTQTLIMRSVRPGIQTACDIRWEIVP